MVKFEVIWGSETTAPNPLLSRQKTSSIAGSLIISVSILNYGSDLSWVLISPSSF